MGHPTFGTFFEIFITILYTNTLKPYPTYGTFSPENKSHKLGYDFIIKTFHHYYDKLTLRCYVQWISDH